MTAFPSRMILPFFFTCFSALPLLANQTSVLSSPDGTISIQAEIGEQITWQVSRKNKTILLPSQLGLRFQGKKPLGEMELVKKSSRDWDRKWENRIYRKLWIRDHANELTLELREKESPHRKLNLIFRAYDEGVAFRYQIPEQPGFSPFVLSKELTTFNFEKDYPAWLTIYKDYKTSQEEPFYFRSLRSVPPNYLIGSPAVVDLGTQKAAIYEADLTDWSGMFLKPSGRQPAYCTRLEAALSPRLDGRGLVVSSAPRHSPWRVLLLGDTEVDLVNRSELMLNLNPPPEGGEAAFAWVKPGATGWDWWVNSNLTLSYDLTIQQIDFAAQMKWPYHTVDAKWCLPVKGEGADMTKPSESLHFPKIFQHAKEKGVGIWLWGHWTVLEANGVDKVFDLFRQWGVKGVKIDFMDRQDQQMVQWYEKVVRSAAKHHIMVNFHGAMKPTGMNRTWPNQITREGIMGNEMVKFNPKVNASHTATLPFTRYLLGPGDFTPGSFNNVLPRQFIPQYTLWNKYGKDKNVQERKIYATEIGTRAHALALCVAYDSPLMTLCDWPEHYQNQPGLEALRNLPTVWQDTRALAGKIGDYYVVARQSYAGDWYLAAITDLERSIPLRLSFLGDGQYDATLFLDTGKNRTDAKAIQIQTQNYTSQSGLNLKLYPAGGAVVIFKKK